jgi:hypothetical protein
MTVHATVCSTTIIQTVVTWEALKMAANTNPRLVVPTTEEQTVAPDMAPFWALWRSQMSRTIFQGHRGDVAFLEDP